MIGQSDCNTSERVHNAAERLHKTTLRLKHEVDYVDWNFMTDAGETGSITSLDILLAAFEELFPRLFVVVPSVKRLPAIDLLHKASSRTEVVAILEALANQIPDLLLSLPKEQLKEQYRIPKSRVRDSGIEFIEQAIELYELQVSEVTKVLYHQRTGRFD